jgi:diguanylate cyclase (GGDEF)-like protein
MDISTIVPLVSTVGCLFLLTLVLLSQQSKMRNAFAVALCLATARSLASFMLHGNFFPEQAILWYCLLTVSLSASIVVYYVFVRAWANKPAGWIAYLGYGLATVVLILCASRIYIQDVHIRDGFLYVEENSIIFYAIALMGLFYCIEIFYELISRYRSLTEPMALNQANYLLVGFAIGMLLGFSNAIPALRGYPVDQLGTFLFCIIITYAIVKHRLLDLKIVFLHLVFIFSRAVLFLVIFAAWLTPIYIYSGYELSFVTAILTALLAVATVSIFLQRASIFLRKNIDRMFYGVDYRYRIELLDFVKRKVPEVLSLEEFGRELLSPLSKALSCRQIYLLLPNTNSGNFVAEYSLPDHGNASRLEIRNDSPVVKKLGQKNQCLSRENINTNPTFLGLWTEERSAFEAFDVRLLFPLISRGNLIGILSLGNKRSGNYSLDDINLVETVTDRVAASLEKEYLQEQLRDREQELTLINRLVGVITSSLNIQDVYDDFITGLKDVIDVDWASVTLIKEDDIQFEALSTKVGSAWQAGERIALKNTAIEWVVSNKKALLVPDLRRESKFSTDGEFIKLGIRSIVYLPFLMKGEVIGSMIIASRKPDTYSLEQIGLLERLAHQIAVSVENSRLYASAEQRACVDELTQLFNRHHFYECLKREINIRSRHGGLLSVVFLDLDLFKNYNDKYGHPDGDRILSHIGFVIGKSLRNIDLAFRYGGDEFAIILPEAEVKDAQMVAERIRVRIDSTMGEKQTGITASLGVASWPSDGVTPDEIVTAADRALYYAKRTGGDRTCTVSEMLSISGEHGESNTRTENENLSMIYALAATIEARDQYTYGHSRNVRRYSVALAEALGLPSENVAVISAAALLHDIGKIGVPDEVLNKPGKLTDKEWELIQRHPGLSAAIVGHVHSLTSCLPAILHHHEWWDGSGYPSGLNGDAIPLEARVLSVADAFEAMISARPYRGSIPVKEALEELKRGAGKQFDPKVVETFVPIALYFR